MKNLSRKMLIASMIVFGSLLYSPAKADPPGMPGSHGTDSDAPPGGGAPISGGLGILLIAAGAYGYTKFKSQTPNYQVKE